MRFTLPLILFTFFTIGAFAQCEEDDTPRVLLIGDSWANFMNTDGTINDVLTKWGHSNFKYYANGNVAVNGAETPDFLEADMQEEIQSILNENPTIDFVHLSIGGNDVMGDWDINFTQAATDQLQQEASVRLRTIIEFLKQAKPGIKVLWSGYCYPNFEEIIQNFAPFQTGHPFYGTWDGMGQPTNLQINNLLNEFDGMVLDYTDTTPNVDFFEAPGILQYNWGQIEPLGVAPGGTYPAFTVPMPYGDPVYPSPIPAMRDYGIIGDCFHLSPEGYFTLVDFHARKYYHKQLMDDMYLLATNDAGTGSVDDNGDVSSDLILGNDGSTSTIQLTFDTSNMPDTTLEEASIFLRRESIIGSDPTAGDLQIRIKNGNIGASYDLEADDLMAATDLTGEPCKFGSTGGAEHWIKLRLPEDALPFISNQGVTQIQILAPNAAGEAVVFSNASDPELAPVLNLNYSGEVDNTSISELADTDVSVYPNPASHWFRVDATSNNAILNVIVFDLFGKRVLSSNRQLVDVSALPSGIYPVRIETENGMVTKRLIKR